MRLVLDERYRSKLMLSCLCDNFSGSRESQVLVSLRFSWVSGSGASVTVSQVLMPPRQSRFPSPISHSFFTFVLRQSVTNLLELALTLICIIVNSQACILPAIAYHGARIRSQGHQALSLSPFYKITQSHSWLSLLWQAISFALPLHWDFSTSISKRTNAIQNTAMSYCPQSGLLGSAWRWRIIWNNPSSKSFQYLKERGEGQMTSWQQPVGCIAAWDMHRY